MVRSKLNLYSGVCIMIRLVILSERINREPARSWITKFCRRAVGMCALLLLGTMSVFAQGKPQGEVASNPNPSATSSDRTTTVRSSQQAGSGSRATADILPQTPVLTFIGPCDRPRKNAAAEGCKTVLTWAEIDTLLNALEPNASPAGRRQLAINYSRLAAAAGVAERQRLEKDPEIAKQIQLQQKLVRMQVLANALYRQIEDRANDVPSSDLERFYAEHQASFVRGDVRRLTIPKSLSAVVEPSADTVALRTLADDFQKRAAAEEDFDQLQQEVLKDFGVKLAVPPTKLNMVGPANLPVVERSVFDLAPGQVSQVLDSPGAFTILKLVSKQPIPMDNAKPEIMVLLQRARAQQEMLEITASGNAQFNLKYLGLPAPPDLFPPPQVVELSVEQGAQSNIVQRMPSRRAMMPHKREVSASPAARR
jgi:hypothetical protein